MRQICLSLLLLLSYQHGFTQTAGITFKGKGLSLANAFSIIEKQTDYTFHFKVEILEMARKVDVNFQNEKLPEVLKVLFTNQPLKYVILDKNIAVSYSPVIEQQGLPLPGSSALTVTGIVVNKRGEPLGNASITVKGTQRGTSTRSDGTFTLENIHPQDVLSISFIGYKTIEKTVQDNGRLMVRLEEADNQLDEVVAQGYSKTTRRLSTSSVSKVTSAELSRQTEMNPLMALQGRVPGMVLTPRPPRQITAFRCKWQTIDSH